MLDRTLSTWNERGMVIEGIWQLPRWMLFAGFQYLFGEVLYVKLGLILAYFVPAFTGGLIIHRLLNQYSRFINKRLSEVILFVAGLAYISAPILINVGGIKFFGHTLASEVMIAFPLILYVLFTKRISFLLLVGISVIVVVFGGSPRELVYYSSFSILALASIAVISKKTFLESSIRFGKLLLLLMPFSTFAWLPYISNEFAIIPNYGSDSIINLESVSSNQELSNSFRGLQKWWSVVDFSTDNDILYYSWFISSWIIPLAAFSSLILIKDNRTKILLIVFSVLATACIFLVKGINPPFGEFYSWLVLEAELPLGINWFFRDPSKFYLYLAFPMALLFTTTFSYFVQMIKDYKKIPLIILVVTILILYSWPLYSGNLRDSFHLTEVPKEYEQVKALIPKDYGNILWVPPYSSGEFIWGTVKATPDPIPILSPSALFSMRGEQEYVWKTIQVGLANEEYGSLLQYLDRLGIKYVIIRSDTNVPSSIDKQISTRVDNFLNEVGGREIFVGQYLIAYELPLDDSYIYGYSEFSDEAITYESVANYDGTNFDSWVESTPLSRGYGIFVEDDILVANLNVSSYGWKAIISPLLRVDSAQSYSVELSIKLINAHSVHVKIFEYNEENRIILTRNAIGIGNGNLDWKVFTFDYTPSSPSVRYVQFQIWHGDRTDKPLPNQVLLKSFSLKTQVMMQDYSEKQSVDYLKESSTKYVVNLDGQGSIYLVLPQAYSPLWMARANGVEYPSLPMYGSVNSFLVPVNGPTKVELYFAPQQFFHIGAVVSLTSLVIAIVYGITRQRREIISRRRLY
jgi:hypothetical protein